MSAHSAMATRSSKQQFSVQSSDICLRTLAVCRLVLVLVCVCNHVVIGRWGPMTEGGCCQTMEDWRLDGAVLGD